jgi:hypothetical protein
MALVRAITPTTWHNVAKQIELILLCQMKEWHGFFKNRSTDAYIGLHFQ